MPIQVTCARGTVPTAVKVQWLWDIRYIDAPVLRWRDTGGDPDLDETLYYCNDANMNVTALVDASSGNVAERYMYSPYGQPEIYDDSWTAVSWANSKKNEILYCGYRWDPETGMYHVRNREYHPTMGRWVARDRHGYINGMNLYEYAVSSPADVFDSFGLESNVKWVPEKKPEDAQPQWESQEELDQFIPEEYKELGIKHISGRANSPVWSDPPGYDFEFSGRCCFCWFNGTFEVKIDYEFWLLKDLQNPQTGKEKARRKSVEDHERGHLAEDAAIPFWDKGLQQNLTKEVAAHDKRETAYEISQWTFLDSKTREAKSKGISTRQQCRIGCRQHLNGVVDNKLEPMIQEIKRRSNARDKKDYLDDAEKRAVEKKAEEHNP
ncbi:MAG: RHS repeat-associated core domain-containing protein [Planctomycetota bacterium]|nr:RHS repeat-associated core domain-containing protein [Planctomycetota bacterium]